MPFVSSGSHWWKGNKIREEYRLGGRNWTRTRQIYGTEKWTLLQRGELGWDDHASNPLFCPLFAHCFYNFSRRRMLQLPM